MSDTNEPRFGQRQIRPTLGPDKMHELEPAAPPTKADTVIRVMWTIFWVGVLGSLAAAGIVWVWRQVLGL